METCRRNAVRRWVLSLHRKHGQFEWMPAAILMATLIFSLTCPLYIWKILGM